MLPIQPKSFSLLAVTSALNVPDLRRVRHPPPRPLCRGVPETAPSWRLCSRRPRRALSRHGETRRESFWSSLPARSGGRVRQKGREVWVSIHLVCHAGNIRCWGLNRDAAGWFVGGLVGSHDQYPNRICELRICFSWSCGGCEDADIRCLNRLKRLNEVEELLTEALEELGWAGADCCWDWASCWSVRLAAAIWAPSCLPVGMGKAECCDILLLVDLLRWCK